MVESLEIPSIQYSIGVAIPCRNVTLTLPGAKPPVSIDLLPWTFTVESSSLGRPKPMLDMPIPSNDPIMYSFPTPGNAPEAVAFILSDSSGWGRAVGAKQIEIDGHPSPEPGQTCQSPTADLQGSLEVHGDSVECGTLDIVWRQVDVPSNVYIVSAGGEYQKAWRFPIHETSGTMAWELALPVDNEYLVTVAGKSYAGFQGRRTVAASSSRGCLSPRARSVSDARAKQRQPKGGLSDGAIIGTAIGAAALVVLAALAVWFLRRRRAPAVRPGEINLHDEWQTESHDQHQVLPFLAQPKAAGTDQAFSETTPCMPSSKAAASTHELEEPEEEIDAEAPLHFKKLAPPSYNHVLWVSAPLQDGAAGAASTMGTAGAASATPNSSSTDEKPPVPAPAPAPAEPSPSLTPSPSASSTDPPTRSTAGKADPGARSPPLRPPRRRPLPAPPGVPGQPRPKGSRSTRSDQTVQPPVSVFDRYRRWPPGDSEGEGAKLMRAHSVG